MAGAGDASAPEVSACPRPQRGGLNWTEILASSGIPEPPGRAETIAAIKAKRERLAAAGELA